MAFLPIDVKTFAGKRNRGKKLITTSSSSSFFVVNRKRLESVNHFRNNVNINEKKNVREKITYSFSQL